MAKRLSMDEVLWIGESEDSPSPTCSMTATDALVNTPLDQWSKLDFTTIIKDRDKKGMSKDTFYNDIEMWQNAIQSLPVYNEQSFRNEIDNMDLNIPTYEVEFQELQGVYSRLVSYRNRIVKMISMVNSHYEIFLKAYKTIKISAVGLYSGTAKDKEASAEHVAQPFYMGTVATKNLLDHMIAVSETIDFAATNMNRILREKESAAKINSVHHTDGMTHNFQKALADEGNQWQTEAIPTRKKVWNIEEDED